MRGLQRVDVRELGCAVGGGDGAEVEGGVDLDGHRQLDGGLIGVDVRIALRRGPAELLDEQIGGPDAGGVRLPLVGDGAKAGDGLVFHNVGGNRPRLVVEVRERCGLDGPPHELVHGGGARFEGGLVEGAAEGDRLQEVEGPRVEVVRGRGRGRG
jgi:hypothetical protein